MDSSKTTIGRLLAQRLDHSRDENSGKLQIFFGPITNAAGCPIAIEVFAGNTSDPGVYRLRGPLDAAGNYRLRSTA
jgi:transposase